MYKSLLFIHITDDIKSGALNLKHSYKYKAFDEYLIDKDYWESNTDALIEKAGLKKYRDINTLLEELEEKLDKEYIKTNRNIIDEKNPYVEIEKGKLKVQTPKVEKAHKKKVSEFFPKNKFIPLLEILSTINNFTNFLEPFEHFHNKRVKSEPSVEVYLAIIIAYGCNIGTKKIAKISNLINEKEINYANTWYFSPENVDAACDKILERMFQLDLPNVFILNVKDKI